MEWFNDLVFTVVRVVVSVVGSGVVISVLRVEEDLVISWGTPGGSSFKLNMEKGDSNRLYAEVEKVGLPTVHITVVVDHEGRLLVLIPLAD